MSNLVKKNQFSDKQKVAIEYVASNPGIDAVATVKNLVSFYVGEHNSRLPHSAFCGQTPDEMYFGTGEHIPTELDTAKKEARRIRLEKNRQATCEVCE